MDLAPVDLIWLAPVAIWCTLLAVAALLQLTGIREL